LILYKSSQSPKKKLCRKLGTGESRESPGNSFTAHLEQESPEPRRESQAEKLEEESDSKEGLKRRHREIIEENEEEENNMNQKKRW
jgi:hypothetical protein